ncbi:Pc20g15510 [Penicillium rubens Wisconsin 54-1255]|uniref:Pc20g15510 protein n=1 Tax=Penicillium rubens (strain ATCC 28089 / DSM 1075 / NRRL 1951 / Wisconsin 54-1255) TaxID=500485 RepID=B6HE05_PENRW|nr:Pc20g15510 [Penicillium rubens Wisconsin 54-1255]
MSTSGNKDFRDQLGKFRLDSINTTPTWPQPTPVRHESIDVSQARSKRVSTACDFCRKRKKKCDFRYPNCSACTRAGVRCTIPPPGPQVASASVPRDQLENLQKRVRWLEEVVRRKSGLSVSELPTGTPVDGEGDPDWWYQVPAMIATGGNRSTSIPSPAGSGGSSATAGPSEASPGVGTELPNIGEIFRDQLEHRRPSVARPSSAPRVMRLSSLEAAERLTGQYFDSIGYQYPFLFRPEFMAHLRHIYTGGVPSPETHHSYHIVIAISLLIGSADPTQAAEFYHASQETLPLALQNEDLPAVRALLGLALYTMFATAGPSIWHVLGATMRLSISMGLHKARSYPSIAEEEMAKRAFWSLYNLDRLIASTLGRPLGIADDDISVGLLRELNDDETEAPGASAMTIPLQVIRLRRIFSRIYQYLVYSSLPRLTAQEATATLSRFRHEVDDWRMTAPVYPSALLYSTSYYDYLYYTTLLLMYRPSPRNPTPDITSIISCGESSIQVIRSYWDSYSVGKLKWIWLTLSQVYFAGITILWCLEQNARSLRESQPAPWHPEEQTMRRAIQAVVVLLEEFGKRRPGVDRLAETFRHQSTVIFSQMAYQQQLEQQQHLHHPQHQPQPPPPPPPALLPPHPMSLAAPPPPPVPLAPVLDDVLLVDGSGTVPMIDPQMAEQLFYSYNWFQEEMASYYTL